MDKIHLYYVYSITTIRNSVLYTGITNDLYRRCSEHKDGNKIRSLGMTFFSGLMVGRERAASRLKWQELLSFYQARRSFPPCYIPESVVIPSVSEGS
jgi:hypothetical protein